MTVEHTGHRSCAPLNREEVRQFHRRGYLGPFTAYTPESMAEVGARIERNVLPTQGPNPLNPNQARHLDQRMIHDLVTSEPVLGRVRSLLGNDILLWATYLYNKRPGGLEIPWHQDANFWSLEPQVNVSIWMAIDNVTIENACVQVIPGSHLSTVPHIRARPGMEFGHEADPAMVDLAKVVNLELRPGEFFMFNERLLHHSHANRSNLRRLGLSARFTTPLVSILMPDSPPLFPGNACVLVSGKDNLHLNRTASPPSTSTNPMGV